MHLLALLVAAVLGSLSLLHVYWGLGGSWGFAVSIPHEPDEPPTLPGAVACFAVAAALLTAAYLCLAQAFRLSLPMDPSLARYGVLGVALVFALRTVGDFRYVGFFKRVVGTEFAKRDTSIYSPLTAAIAAATGLLWLLGARA